MYLTQTEGHLECPNFEGQPDSVTTVPQSESVLRVCNRPGGHPQYAGSGRALLDPSGESAIPTGSPLGRLGRAQFWVV